MDNLSRIAIVEDDSVIRAVLEMALAGAGYANVESFARGDEAMSAIRRSPPDLVLLDVMLPGLDGFSIARKIRSDPALADVRIVMLTARTQNEDVLEGLEAGADDYVPKPFDRKVLLARVKAVLRRGELVSPPGGIDGLVLDDRSMSATLDGADIPLTAGEYKILSLMCAKRGRILTRDAILDALAPDGSSAPLERTVDVQIANIRRRLGRWAPNIETVRGVGYRVRG